MYVRFGICIKTAMFTSETETIAKIKIPKVWEWWKYEVPSGPKKTRITLKKDLRFILKGEEVDKR